MAIGKIAAEPFIAEIRESTRRLRDHMDSLFDSGSQLRPAQPQQMQDLLSELLHVGEWLSGRPTHSDPALDHELIEYRTQVERLRILLPEIQSALLAERARLEQERTHLQAALNGSSPPARLSKVNSLSSKARSREDLAFSISQVRGYIRACPTPCLRFCCPDKPRHERSRRAAD